VGVSRDVTDERRAELALQKSEQKYRQIVETAAEGVWVIDDRLRTVFVNHKMAAMLGCHPDECRDDWCPTSCRPRKVRRSSNNSSKPMQRKYRRPSPEDRATGRWFGPWLSSSPMIDEAGRRTGTLAMLSDVTERKMLEEQFRQAQKLEAVGRFASGVAHDSTTS